MFQLQSNMFHSLLVPLPVVAEIEHIPNRCEGEIYVNISILLHTTYHVQSRFLIWAYSVVWACVHCIIFVFILLESFDTPSWVLTLILIFDFMSIWFDLDIKCWSSTLIWFYLKFLSEVLLTKSNKTKVRRQPWRMLFALTQRIQRRPKSHFVLETLIFVLHVWSNLVPMDAL